MTQCSAWAEMRQDILHHRHCSSVYACMGTQWGRIEQEHALISSMEASYDAFACTSALALNVSVSA